MTNRAQENATIQRNEQSRFRLGVLAVVIILVCGWVPSIRNAIFPAKPDPATSLHGVLAVQAVKLSDVKELVIRAAIRDPQTAKIRCRVVFLAPADRQNDVARILDSLKRLHVTKAKRRIPPTDRIVVTLMSGRRIVFDGSFDPSHAPAISETLQSSDLGAIVRDVLGRDRDEAAAASRRKDRTSRPDRQAW